MILTFSSGSHLSRQVRACCSVQELQTFVPASATVPLVYASKYLPACYLHFLIHIGSSGPRRRAMRGVRESDDAPFTPRPDTDQPSSRIESSSHRFRMFCWSYPCLCIDESNSRTRHSRYLRRSGVNLSRLYPFLKSAMSIMSRRVMIRQNLLSESRDN